MFKCCKLAVICCYFSLHLSSRKEGETSNPLPFLIHGFNHTGRRNCHKFQLFFYTLTLDSAELPGQLPSAHLKTLWLGERRWKKWRWVQTATFIFTYGCESPTCLKLRKPWCIESPMPLISVPAWDVVGTFQWTKTSTRAWASACAPAATRLVGNGGVHWKDGTVHRIRVS